MFAHRLALKLGQPSVSRMMAAMSNAEFVEWMAYERIEPWGQMVIWRYLSEVIATVINMAGKVSKKTVRPDELMPRWETKKEATPGELWETFKRWATGGRKGQ